MTTPFWDEYDSSSSPIYIGDIVKIKLPRTDSPGDFSVSGSVVISDGYIIFSRLSGFSQTSTILTQAASGGYASRTEAFSLTPININDRRVFTQNKTIGSNIPLTGTVTSATSTLTEFKNNQLTCVNLGGPVAVTVIESLNLYKSVTYTFQLTVTKLTPTLSFTMPQGILQVPRVTVPSGLAYTATYTQNGQVVAQPRRSGPYILTVNTPATGTYFASTATFNFTFTRGSTARLLRSMGINYPYRR